jgi:hypothetical protein
VIPIVQEIGNDNGRAPSRKGRVVEIEKSILECETNRVLSLP